MARAAIANYRFGRSKAPTLGVADHDALPIRPDPASALNDIRADIHDPPHDPRAPWGSEKPRSYRGNAEPQRGIIIRVSGVRVPPPAWKSLQNGRS